MHRFPPHLIPNDVQWNRWQRPPQNPQWRPFHGPRAFRPRSQGFNNYRPPMQGAGVEHWCETCDRGFPNEQLLNNHKQQHQKCNIDGCQFIAHPKVITKHIQMQHSSGLYKKIAKLSNPEEIEKWREERRKKYPTKTNIDKKEAEIKEKIERGEKMGLGRRDWRDKRENRDQYRDFRSGQGGVKRGYNHSNDSQPGSKFRKTNNRKPKKPNIVPADGYNRKLAPFAGIQSLEPDSDNDEVDEIQNGHDLIHDDDIGVVEEKPEVEKPIVCGALSSLICEYGSSEDEVGGIENPKSNAKETNKKGESKTPVLKLGSRKTSEVDNINLINIPQDVNGKLSKPDNKNESTDTVGNDNGSEEIKLIKNQNSSEKIREKLNETFEKIENKLNREKTNDNDDGNDSGPEEAKVVKNEESPNALQNNAENKNVIVKKQVETKKKPVFRKPKPKLPSTLIYRLLSKEMKQERNIILQCIRHIRKNNYFDK